MRKHQIFGALITLLTHLGCTTQYQPYGSGGGYFESKINEEVWFVTFSGSGNLTNESAQTYWLYRACEITLENGYQGFAVVRRNEGSPKLVDIREVIDENRFGPPTLRANIVLLDGPLPDRPAAVFNAKKLKDYLEPYVTGKKCRGNVCPHVHAYFLPGFNEEN